MLQKDPLARFLSRRQRRPLLHNHFHPPGRCRVTPCDGQAVGLAVVEVHARDRIEAQRYQQYDQRRGSMPFGPNYHQPFGQSAPYGTRAPGYTEPRDRYGTGSDYRDYGAGW